MYTLRSRLITAFFSVIGALTLGSLVFFYINTRVIDQYRSITDTMTAEYQLVNTMPILIDAFNREMQSAGTDSSRSEADISSAKKNIKDLTSYLDTSITDTNSRASYLGFKASVDNLTTQIDESLVRFQQGSIKDYFTDFDEANKLYGFVRDNGTVLLFSELEYASGLRDVISRTYFYTVLFGATSLAILLLCCIVFVLQFAKRLTSPLRSLAEVAEHIVAGDAHASIDPKLIAHRDETGSLAKSFNTMINKLFENINTLDASNKEIAESSHVLEEKNNEFERLNKLMVDRELKMIELKKQNEALQLQLKSKL